MSDILHIETNSGGIILSGSVEKIISNRRAMRFMKDWMVYKKYGSTIQFDVADNLNKCLDRIKNIAQMVDCAVDFSKEVSEAVNEYAIEEEKFKEFSLKALDIRNNNCDIKEFIEFKNSLIENMPNRTLYDLQMLSAYHLAFSQNGCNFSVPGAGKTSVVYGAYTYLKNLISEDIKNVDKIVIVGPLSSFGPWELEFEECFGRKANSKRLIGQMSLEEKRQYLYEENTAELILISYASVYSLTNELKYFLQKNRVMMVLDEAHKIKNTSGGITATAILDLASRCKARVVLTGTPAPNGYDDLFNLFKFIWPTKSVIKFQIGQLRDMSKNMADPRVKVLLDSLMPYFVRIRKNDLGIPPAINNPPIIVEMKPTQRKIYDFIESKYITDIVDCRDQKFKNELVRARLIRLMQAATNPELLKRPLNNFADAEEFDFSDIQDDSTILSKILRYNQNEIPAKFEVARELIKKIIANGEKVIVWACYIKSIEMFSKYLDSTGIKSKILYGATPIAADGMTPEDEDYEFTRESIIRQFHTSDSDFKVIIANPFAVAESISLHKACHNAIYLERSFNAAHFLQSKDRIHRYGLKDGIVTNYYYLISKDSVDEVIQNRLSEKERRLLEIIESMPIPLFDNALLEGGDDDIKAVLKDYARRVKTK